MAWDDWVFGIATGGLYNVGKTVYKAGKAADEAGDAIEEIADGAGTALAAVGSTITKLGKDLSSFLNELEELLTIKRVTARNEDDLWDEEVERLTALRQYEADLVAQLEALEKEDDDKSWFESLLGGMLGQLNSEELTIRMKLAIVRSAISEILYEEPGVVPTTLYHFKEILERFNTLEQPRLEDLLDSVEETVDETTGILKEVKKLFVIQTWQAVPIAELSVVQKDELEFLNEKFERFENLINKHKVISGQLQIAVLASQPEKFEMPKLVGVPNVAERMAEMGMVSSAVTASIAAGEVDRVSSGAIKKESFLKTGPSFSMKGKATSIAMQPLSASVSSALNQNSVSAYMENFNVVEGRLKYFEREKLKLEKRIFRIKFILVEEPGVIPKILEEVRGSLAHLRSETLDRVDALLDSITATVNETTDAISNLNQGVGKLNSVLEFFSEHSGLIKIAMVVLGVLLLSILVGLAIVLLRMAFGI